MPTTDLHDLVTNLSEAQKSLNALRHDVDQLLSLVSGGLDESSGLIARHSGLVKSVVETTETARYAKGRADNLHNRVAEISKKLDDHLVVHAALLQQQQQYEKEIQREREITDNISKVDKDEKQESSIEFKFWKFKGQAAFNFLFLSAFVILVGLLYVVHVLGQKGIEDVTKIVTHQSVSAPVDAGVK